MILTLLQISKFAFLEL